MEVAIRILIFGGARFLGRHLVDAALARGREVTLFTRGRSGPELYPERTWVDEKPTRREQTAWILAAT